MTRLACSAWVQGTLLLAVTLWLWQHGLAAPFQFDDWNVIVANSAVHSLANWWQSMPGIRPLLKLSYALQWSGEAQTVSMRSVNVALHALNVLLLWRILQRWPGWKNPSQPAVAKHQSPSAHTLGNSPDLRAFWAALLFALHPVQAQAVTYISGRSMSLMALAWLTALLCWLRSLEAHEVAHTKAHRIWQAAACLSFVLAVAVRETALVLPLVGVVWLLARHLAALQAIRTQSNYATTKFDSREQVQRVMASLWHHTAALWICAIVCVALVLMLPGYQRLMDVSLNLRSPWHNLAQQGDALVHQLIHPLLLLRTNIDAQPALSVIGSPLWWGKWLLALLPLLLAFKLRRRPAVWLAVLWFYLHLLPTNSVLARLDLTADRHLYLALAGAAVLSVSLIDQLSKRLSQASTLVPAWLPSTKPALLSHLMLLLLALGLTHASLRDIHHFRSESSLWQASIERTPTNPRAWNNLGYAHLIEGHPDAAIQAFHQALHLAPHYPVAQANLARVLEQTQPSTAFPASAPADHSERRQ